MNDFIEKLTGALAPLFQYLEHEVIIDVARRIRDTMHYTATAELQAKAMKELGFSPNKIRAEAMKTLNADKKYRKEVAKNTLGFKRKVRNLIAGIRKKAMKEGDELFTGAADTINNANLATWRSEGKEITDSSYLPELVNSIQEQTHGEIENITRTTGFQGMSGYESIENLYRKELDKAVIKIMSGTFSQEQVVADVVHNLAKSGLRSIDFASGHSMQLDTAVRLALRTSVHQLQAKINDENILRSGENLVYVSKHWGARNKGTGVENHESWQGKVYYIKPGKDYSREASRIGQPSIDDLWEATGYSIDGAHENNPLGLNGYNCRHMVRVWYEGASSLPDEDPVPPSAVYNGREYDYYAQTQKMRRMEREVRALRREKEALEVLGYDTDEIDVKVKQKRREYSEFCEACLQKEQPERMRYECRTSNLRKTKAWKEYGEEKSQAVQAAQFNHQEADNAAEKDVLEAYSNFINKIREDEHPSVHKNKMAMYAEYTKVEEDSTIEQAFLYDIKNDIIKYNRKSQDIYDYDMNYAFAHEISHRMDYLEYNSWTNRRFLEAIEICSKKVYSNRNEIQKWFDEGAKYEKSFALSDIIGILGNGNISVPVGHKEGYLKKNPVYGTMEIFANLSSIDILGLNEKEEVIKELFEAYEEIVK